MSSLQEQLLKAGLVDQKKLARARLEKNKQANSARKQRGKAAAKPAQAKPAALSRKAQRDLELNEKRRAELRRKELAAQAQQMIDANLVDRGKGDLPYSFVYKRKVKKIYVTAEQKKQLADGKLVIVTCVRRDGRKFELVPDAIAARVAERDPTFIVESTPPAAAENAAEPNDPYAGYEVPDDLVW